MLNNQVSEVPTSAIGQRIYFLRKQMGAIESAIAAASANRSAYKRKLAKSLNTTTDVLRDLGALAIAQATRGAA